MAEFTVICEVRVREQYVVEAETEEEAREKWSDTEPTASEVIDGEVVEVVAPEPEETND